MARRPGLQRFKLRAGNDARLPFFQSRQASLLRIIIFLLIVVFLPLKQRFPAGDHFHLTARAEQLATDIERRFRHINLMQRQELRQVVLPYQLIDLEFIR